MSKIRVLVGTRKGAFILTADAKREQWKVTGPHFAGLEIYHLKASAVDPERIFASQVSDWFGQQIQRSNDGGHTWEPVGNEFKYDGTPGTHQWYDGTQHPWEFKRVWHLEPSLTDPDTVYAGVEDAGLFKTVDGGRTWQELPGTTLIVESAGDKLTGNITFYLLKKTSNELEVADNTGKLLLIEPKFNDSALSFRIKRRLNDDVIKAEMNFVSKNEAVLRLESDQIKGGKSEIKMNRNTSPDY